MPLPPPSGDREQLHTRKYCFEGFHRADGLWDIEGHMTDTKTYGFDNEFRGHIKPDEPIHDMWIRLTVGEDMVVRDIHAETDAGPYAVCPAITPNFKRMIGVRVGTGWRRAIAERVGGVEGCTHLVEMLGAMATPTFQTLYPALAKKAAENPKPRRPGLIDTCHAFKSDGEVVKKSWPDYYTGD